MNYKLEEVLNLVNGFLDKLYKLDNDDLIGSKYCRFGFCEVSLLIDRYSRYKIGLEATIKRFNDEEKRKWFSKGDEDFLNCWLNGIIEDIDGHIV
jgi:hypothetical protein